MSGSSADEEKKGKGKGGKRSVTHLSQAQLQRKRANDREAQRSIRQRTKEHIENLERKVKELEALQANPSGGSNSAAIERVYRRNQELEIEINVLRSQLRAANVSQSPTQASDYGREDMSRGRVDWQSQPATSQWHARGPEYSRHPNMAQGYTTLPAPIEYMGPEQEQAGYPAATEWTTTAQHHHHGLPQTSASGSNAPPPHYYANYGPHGQPPQGGWPPQGGPQGPTSPW